MNEIYAADPSVCRHVSELKLLLASFGPYTGRYLANYPTDWISLVEKNFDNFGEIEVARVKTILRRAKENMTIVTRTNLAWDPAQTWLENAKPLLNTVPVLFDGLIAQQALPPSIHHLHDLDFPPTSEERIPGIASEYARVSKVLMLLSPELVLVDPYLNPAKRSYAPVLEVIFSIAAKGKCRKISLWARASELFKSCEQSSIKSELKDSIYQLALNSGFNSSREIEMILVEDEKSQAKMHGRYLLSIKGGIRFDQGFQKLPEGRRVDVGPIGKEIHNKLLDIYFDGKHDMQHERLVIKL